VLSLEEEAIIVAFRKHTLLPLDDCLYALQPTIPRLRFFIASLLATSRDQPASGGRRRQADQEEVQELPDPDIQVRLRRTPPGCGQDGRGPVGIEHRLTKLNHPWTNGQVERMNRTIKEATVKRFHYDDHNQLRRHLADFVSAYNFARRLKTLNGLTPYEFICKRWTSEPNRFIINPLQQMPGLNSDRSIVEGGDEGVGVERLVGDQSARRDGFDQRFGTSQIVILAGAEHHLDGIAEGIDERVNFGGQSAAGSADGLRTVFFGRRRYAGERARWWRQSSCTRCRDRWPIA
jgi:hypothetical protein